MKYERGGLPGQVRKGYVTARRQPFGWDMGRMAWTKIELGGRALSGLLS